MTTNPNPPQAGVQPGDVLAGKYRVERVLGSGGMGVVVAAHHLQLDERVALKFLLPVALGNPDSVARFVREAQAAVKIKSEHVVRVTDIGELENGAPYIVMEYLEGSDLAHWLMERGPTPVEQAVDFVLQTCEAIALAHTLGIVHRDLKPSNLFCCVRPDGRLSVKVLDFGISKITRPGAHGHGVTSTTEIVGSPAYMSPEQFQSSKGVDSRTDIWSIGVILFELLTGSLPFLAETITELIVRIAMDPAPPVRSLRPDVPAGLEQAVARCLHKDREQRFPSVSALARALGDFGSRKGRASVERIVETWNAAGIASAAVSASSQPSAAASAPISPPAGTQPAQGAWNETQTSTRFPRPSRRPMWVTGGILATVAVAAAVVVRARQVAPLPAAPLPPASIVTIAPMLTPVATPPPIAPPDSASASSPTATPQTKSAPAAPARRQHKSAGPSPQPASDFSTAAPESSPPPAAVPAENCSPPYFIDSSGHRQYKPACL